MSCIHSPLTCDQCRSEASEQVRPKDPMGITRATLDFLQGHSGDLMKENRRLMEENGRLIAENAGLKEQVAALKKKSRSRRS